MLVLTRKVGSILKIGTDMEVELLSMTIMPQKAQNRADLALTIGEYRSIETVFEGVPFAMVKNIYIQVFNFEANQLRMGITASREVKIVRAEIARAKR